MPDHKIGTREEWEAARAELARLEAEQAERDQEIKAKRLELPWVRSRRRISSTPRTERKASRTCSSVGRSCPPTTSCLDPTSPAVQLQRSLPTQHCACLYSMPSNQPFVQ